MRLRTIAFSLLLVACQSMPEKPVVEVGDIDFPASEVITRLSEGTEPSVRVPISSYDKATCFKPAPWEQVKVYLKLLEDYASRCRAASEAKP